MHGSRAGIKSEGDKLCIILFAFSCGFHNLGEKEGWKQKHCDKKHF